MGVLYLVEVVAQGYLLQYPKENCIFRRLALPILPILSPDPQLNRNKLYA